MSKNGNGAVRNRGKINYVEPNDLPAFFKAKVPAGQTPDNIGWDPEDMNIFVDLQVVIPSRQYDPSSIKEYGDFNFNDVKYQSVLSGVKLRTEKGDGGNFLTTDWTNMSYQEIRNNRAGSKETLGINSINISFDSNMYPRVTMNFTDVRGSALMGVQEQAYVDKLNGVVDSEVTKSFFSSVFKFPYPRFLLSVKGYYGTCVTFVLSVEDFRGNFNSESGNFDITIKFMGHMYGLYTDIPMNYLLVAPYIGSSDGGLTLNEYWKSQIASGVFTYNDSNQRGAPIMTFIEFYQLFQDVAASGTFENALGEAGTQIGKNSLEDSSLTNILNLSKEFWINGTMIGGNDNPVMAKNTMYCEVDGKGYVFFDKSLDGLVLNVNPTLLKDISKSVKEYKTNFPGGFFSNAKAYEYDPFSKFYREDEVDSATVALTALMPNPEYKPKNTAETTFAFDGTSAAGIKQSTWEKILAALGNRNVTANDSVTKSEITIKDCYAYLEYDLSFKNDVDTYIGKIKQESSELMTPATDEVELFLKSQLGFDFTIENVMRMLFAHFDTFIKCYYDAVKEVKGSRTLGTLGGWKRNNTDISSSSDENAHVPPFTAFFNNDGKRVYPGDIEAFPLIQKMPEVKLVEDIFNGIGTLKDYLGEIESMGEEDSGEEQVESPISWDFQPIMPNDVMTEGKNPYDTVSTNDLSQVLFFYLKRELIFEILYYGNDRGLNRHIADSVRNTIGEIEAKNFIKSELFKNNFKNNDAFLAQVKNFEKNTAAEISNGFKGIRDDKFKYYVPAKGEYAAKTYRYIGEKEKLPLVVNGTNTYPENYELYVHVPFIVTEKSLINEISPSLRGYWHKEESIYSNAPLLIPLSEGSKVEQSETKVRISSTGDGESIPFPYTEKGNNIIAGKSFAYYNKENKYGKNFKQFINNETVNAWVPYVDIDNKNAMTSGIKCATTEDACLRALEVLFKVSGFYSDTFWEKVKKLLSIEDFENFYGEILNPSYSKIIEISELDFNVLCGICYLSQHQDLGNASDEKGKLFKELWHIFGKYAEKITNKTFLETYSKTFEDFVAKEFMPLFTYTENASERECVYQIDGKPCALKKGRETIKLPYYGDNRQKFFIDLFKQTKVLVLLPTFPKGLGIFSEQSVENCVSSFVKSLDEQMPKNSESSIPASTESNTSSTDNADVDVNEEAMEDNKAACYYTLKNLYDRWLAMLSREDFELYSPEEEAEYKKLKMNGESADEREIRKRSEFLNFVYVDSFYNDISKKFTVNPMSIFELVGEHLNGESNQNVWEFICAICQANKLLPRCLPVYSNIYSQRTFAEIFTPNQMYGGINKIGRKIGNTYVLMYTYEPSHFLNVEDDKSDGVGYANDSFDIADTAGDPTPLALSVMSKDKNKGENNYDISAFGVTAARQNQQYFTKISVGMDNPRVTDFSIMNMFQLADMAKRGGTVNTKGVGQDLYSIYSNRSYDCSVEMLGCANIMPMMYFQLNNVPMFKGAYMITKVEHNIQNNTMTTRFTGTRLPKRYVPFVSNELVLKSLKASLGNINRGGAGYLGVDYGTAPVTDKSAANGKTFYVKNAVAQMNEKLCRNGKCKIGSTEGSLGLCATFVQFYINAAFNGVVRNSNGADSIRVNNGFTGCNGYKMRYFLAANGFDIVAQRSDMVNNTFKPEAGDICVMNRVDFDGKGKYGHVCMYDGTKWVSDFVQNRGWNCYGSMAMIMPKEYDVLVYRFPNVDKDREFDYEKCVVHAKPTVCNVTGDKVYRNGRAAMGINFADFIVPEDKMDTFINALAKHESGEDADAIGDNGAAVGVLQMHPSAVAQYKIDTGSNEYKFYNGTDSSVDMATSGASKTYFAQYASRSKWGAVPEEVKSLDSRYDAAASKKMCKEILSKHASSRSFIKMCDVWNTWSGHAPASYVNDVKYHYDKLLA